MRRPEWFVPVRGIGEWIGFLGGLAAVGFPTLLAWSLATGGTDLDVLLCVKPGEPCRYSDYRVRNDTPNTVELHWCEHHCGDGDRRIRTVFLAPGETTVADDNGVIALLAGTTWWEVVNGYSRARLGCLALDGHGHKRDGDLVVVSDARACGSEEAATPSVAARS